MKRIKYIFLLVLSYYCTLISGQARLPNGQEIWNIEFYNQKNGLSQNNVTGIVQDKYSYLWIGTHNGLNRFDGYDFKNYDLQDPFIDKLFLDYYKNLWILSGKSLYLFDYDEDIPLEFPVFYDKIYSVYQKNKSIYISGERNLYIIKVKENGNHQLDSLNVPDGFLPVNNLYVDKNKNVWGEKERGVIARYNPNALNNRIIAYNIDDHSISSLIPNANDILIASTETAIFKYNAAKYSFVPFEIGTSFSRHTNEIYIENDSTWYIENERSLLVFNPIRKNINHSISFRSKGEILNYFRLGVKYKDSFGNWWFGTNYGLGKVSSYLNLFSTIQIYTDKTNEKSKRIVSMEFLNDSILLIGLEKGLILYNIDTKEYEDFTEVAYFNGVKYPNEAVLSIQKITDELFAIGGVGSVIIDIKNKQMYLIDINENMPEYSLSNWTVWDMEYDCESNDLWLGTIAGLNKINLTEFLYNRKNSNSSYRISRLNEKVIHYLNNPNDSNSLFSNYIYQISIDIDNDLWIANEKGLSIYNSERNSFFNIDIPSRVVLLSNDNIAFIGTEGEGLYCIEINKHDHSYKVLYQCTKKDGLPSNVIWGILHGSNSEIWISSTGGLSCFNTQNMNIKNYGYQHGLQDDEFTRGGFATGKTGELYFAGNNGINFFHPKDIQINKTDPSIIINEFIIFNKQVITGQKINGDIVLPNSILSTKEVCLNHKNNNFSIGFTALHYSIPENIKYSYKLEGLKNEGTGWTIIDASYRHANYMNLPAGEYIFYVKATNEDGVWGDNVAQLNIKILPPFYKTWLFRVFLLVIIISTILGYVHIRNKRIKRQNKLLLKMVRERTKELFKSKEEVLVQKNQLAGLNATKDKFFSIIAHDLRNPFMAISSSSSLLFNRLGVMDMEKIKDLILMIKNSSDSASDLLENLLQWARSQTGNIEFRPTDISLLELCKKVYSLLKIQADDKGIQILINLNKDICFVGDKNMINTILRNLLSNAIKFTPENGKISISFNIVKNNIQIKVKDSGMGMSHETLSKLFRIDQSLTRKGTLGEKGTGIGLIVCMDFAKKHKGTILVHSELNKGSTFTLDIPFKEANKELFEDKKEILENKVKIEEHPVSDNTIKKLKKIGKEQKELLSGEYEVLVIDDIDEIRNNIYEILSANFKVYQANNGKDGLKLAFEKIPDIIISDVMMPEINGLELALELKNNEKTSHIPIILLTARDTEKNIIEGIRTGVDDYITKPFNLEVLKIKLENLITNRIRLRNQIKQKLITEPNIKIIESANDKLIRKAMNILEEKFEDNQFNLEDFEKGMSLSRAQLYRKIKAITGYSPMELIRVFRLKRAAQLLKDTDDLISSICYMVGFNNTLVFRDNFKKQYGLTPKSFREKKKK